MTKKVCVIYGGKGNEHDVSLASGEHVSAVLSPHYEVHNVFLSKNNEWLLDGVSMTQEEVLEKVYTENYVVIPMIHGEFGEDGELQKLLEEKGIRFIFSDSTSSALAIDKDKASHVFRLHGLLTPKSIVITRVEDVDAGGIFPAIIKPKTGGSSIDLYKVSSEEEIMNHLPDMLTRHSEILLQEFVEGREFTCGVYEKLGEIIALPPTEIILTKTKVFDYEAKYNEGACLEVTPPEVSDDVIQQIQETAKKAHMALSCKDLSRTDMIMTSSGDIVVLETNTIPGMTKTSFIPAQVKASGYTLYEFLDIVISNHF